VSIEVERFFSEQSPLATEMASFRPRAQQRDIDECTQEYPLK
jgi:ATP-dependent DNA helicase DinG